MAHVDDTNDDAIVANFVDHPEVPTPGAELACEISAQRLSDPKWMLRKYFDDELPTRGCNLFRQFLT